MGELSPDEDEQSFPYPLDSSSKPDVEYEFLGHGFKVESRMVLNEVVSYFENLFGEHVPDAHVGEVWEFKRCRIGSKKHHFDIETESHSQERCRSRSGCRQKFLIAGTFCSEKNDAVKTKAYYGYVKKFWSVSFQLYEQSEVKAVQIGLVKVDWQYGISKDKTTGMFFVNKGKKGRRGGTRHTVTTTEDVHCIQRLIGFFDHDDRRYFMDMERRKLQGCDGMELGGRL